MSEKHWWRVYGHFEPWEMCPTRPDPGEVLLFSLDRRGIRPEQHIDYLMKLLDLQKTMVENPAMRSKLMAVLCKAAMTFGTLPAWTVLRTSPMVTSLT